MHWDGQQWVMIPTPEGIPEVEPEPEDKDMTESERRIFMFNSIQKQTGPAVDMIEARGFDPSNLRDRFAEGVLNANWAKSTEGQMYDAAAGAWAEGALRLATGAAATPEEHSRIKGMYFAQVGDSLETIKFKQAMRHAYQEVLAATLNGDIDAGIPNPLMFAIEQYYNGRPGQVTDGASSNAPGQSEAPAAPTVPVWTDRPDGYQQAWIESQILQMRQHAGMAQILADLEKATPKAQEMFWQQRYETMREQGKIVQ